MKKSFPFSAYELIKNKRALVMECSVAVEQMISNQVCLLMDIDRKSSKLFGIGSSSLSFNQKVDFLVELKYYNKVQKEKLNRFAEIRNKFAHVGEISTFQECFILLSGIVLKFAKWYPEISSLNSITEEERFLKYFLALFIELEKEVDRFVEHYNKRLHERTSLEVKSDHFDALVDAIFELGKEMDNPELELFIKKCLDRSNELYEVLDKKRNSINKVDHKIVLEHLKFE